MAPALQAYALVFEPAAHAPDDEKKKGRLITLHNSVEAALDYYKKNRDELLTNYSNPATTRYGKDYLPIAIITPDSCRGTAYHGKGLKGLRRNIANAVRNGLPCLSTRFDSTAARPELISNEINKLFIQATLEFFEIPQASPTPPTQKAARRSAPKSTPK